MIYSYSEGDLIKNPQGYHYTVFMGEEFICSWRISRELAIEKLPDPKLPQLKNVGGVVNAGNTLSLLMAMCRALRNTIAHESDQKVLDYWLLRLLKKFEVSKHLYTGYQTQEPHPPLPDSNYFSVDSYLWLAENLLRAWQRDSATYLLSGALKLNDTLISQISYLDSVQGSHLAWILKFEQQSLAKLYEEISL